MSNLPAIPLSEVYEMAEVISASGFFGVKTPQQAMALMLVAQAEGRHPATIAQEYDVIQGRPALKSQAALARFQAAGGRIQWTERSTKRCAALFSHPAGGDLEVAWDMDRANAAGLTGKDNWKKFPVQMLSARVVSEGVRAVFPACLGGLYLAEEVQDFEQPQPKTQRQANPIQVEVPHIELANATERDALLADLKAAGFTREHLAQVMGKTKLKEMTHEQFCQLDAMLRDRQDIHAAESGVQA